MDELKLIFASNLIRLRTAAGMTQAELGEQLNYSDKSISKWERGEAIPDAAVLKRMSEIFGVTVDYLLNEHDAWQPGPEPAACDRSHHAIILVALMGIVTLAVLVFVVLCAVLPVYRLWALAAALALGLAACDASAVVPGSSTPTVSTAQPAGDDQTANFEMHFLDVGQALSVLVECDGQYMLYDGGNVDDGSYVVSYLQNLGVEELQYVFCSHAHEDHVGGLAAALAYFPADHVYSPVTEASTKCFQDFVKYTQQQGLQVEVPAAGTVWPLGSATVTMLGPVAQYDNTNDTSIVLRVDYGSTSFLLTGDMESDAERDLVNSGANLRQMFCRWATTAPAPARATSS